MLYANMLTMAIIILWMVLDSMRAYFQVKTQKVNMKMLNILSADYIGGTKSFLLNLKSGDKLNRRNNYYNRSIRNVSTLKGKMN